LVLIVMGVVGSGKTTIGKLLAQKLGWQFADADNFHSPENVEKIRHGIALTDDDRAPWLQALREAITKWHSEHQNVVLACSALKRSYREELSVGDVKFVYLKGNREVVLSRLRERHGHFATESILNAQFRDLEEPHEAITVSIEAVPEEIVTDIIAQLALTQNSVTGRHSVRD
jgi:gluconokinase